MDGRQLAPAPVAGLVLAAGESRRFGRPKQLALLEGRTLLEHVIERALAAELAPVVAVVPVWLTRPGVWTDERLRWVRNPHPERGMSHSLRLGAAAVPPDVEAVVILLGDQPTVAVDAIRAVVAARGDEPIVACYADGHPAPPVLVERTRFALFEVVEGDEGLRRLLAAHREWVKLVEVPWHAPDVDLPDDLGRLGER